MKLLLFIGLAAILAAYSLVAESKMRGDTSKSQERGVCVIEFQLIPWRYDFEKAREYQFMDVDSGVLAVIAKNASHVLLGLYLHQLPGNDWLRNGALEGNLQPRDCNSESSSQAPAWKLREGEPDSNESSSNEFVIFYAEATLPVELRREIDKAWSNMCVCVQALASGGLKHVPKSGCFSAFRLERHLRSIPTSSRNPLILKSKPNNESDGPRRQLQQWMDSASFYDQRGNAGTIVNQDQNANQDASAVGKSNVMQSNSQDQAQDSPSTTISPDPSPPSSSWLGSFFSQIFGGRYSITGCVLTNSCSQVPDPFAILPSGLADSVETVWSFLDEMP